MGVAFHPQDEKWAGCDFCDQIVWPLLYELGVWYVGFVKVIIIIIIINPLTTRVIGTPQIISQHSFLHFSLFSTALWDLVNSRPVHSQMLSFHLFLYLPCRLPPFTVPCKMVLARPDERVA